MLKMLGVIVPKRSADLFRKKYGDAILREFKPVCDEKFVIFPVKEKINGYNHVNIEFERRSTRPRSLEDALKGKLPDNAMKLVVKSFDIVGDVALVRIPEEIWEYRGVIGRALMEVHKNVRTVAAKKGVHEGEYRTQKVEVICGDGRLETCYREHGVRMWLEVGSVYFSPRLSYERKRIASQVKPGERVAVFFAGVGPFALVIASKQPLVRKVYAIELNPVAYKYLERNIVENKLEDRVIPIEGDVREEAPIYCCGSMDRVVMPLPKDAHDFLDVALLSLGKKGIIHFYSFAPEDDPFSEAVAFIKKEAEREGRRARILHARKVRPYAPGICQVVVDAEITL